MIYVLQSFHSIIMRLSLVIRHQIRTCLILHHSSYVTVVVMELISCKISSVLVNSIFFGVCFMISDYNIVLTGRLNCLMQDLVYVSSSG